MGHRRCWSLWQGTTHALESVGNAMYMSSWKCISQIGLVIGCKSQYEHFPISCTSCCSPHAITIAPTICLMLLFQQPRIAKYYYCHMAPNNANYRGFKPKIWLKNDWVWGNLVFKGCKLPLDAKLVGTSLESALLGGAWVAQPCNSQILLVQQLVFA